MAQDHEKAELIAELERARSTTSANFHLLRRDLDFSLRAKKSFAKNPLPWLGGAAFLGLLVARIPRRTKKVVRVVPKRKDDTAEKAGKAGLLLAAMKMAFDFARPALLKWATQRFSNYMGAAHTRNPQRF
jgi:hypothetical protein